MKEKTEQTQQNHNVSPVNPDNLNPSQYQAVTTTEGPVLVIAGAGSGKTRTLVFRVAHLIEQGVPPEKILLLTFTRKAAQEMVWRAGKLLQGSCSRVVGGTFHGVANMLLRRFGSHLGFSSSFSIIDRADAEGIINLLKSSLGLTGREKQFPSKRILMNMFSGSINKSKSIDDLVYEQYAHLAEHLDDIKNLNKHYHQFKFDHGLMDYDDLLVNWKRLLAEVEEARIAMASCYSHIMVDEYQDTNLIQADIVRLLAYKHDNVMAVGDDSQSIYSFRGADFYNIMRFPKIYEDTRIIKLEENYRSAQPILSLTNGIISNAAEKYTKTLFSSIEGDVQPVVYRAKNEHDEAAFVRRTIGKLLRDDVPLNEVAVLFRSGFHSYKLEIELNSAGIEFEKRGGMKLTEAAHMKDVLSFLRLVVNPRDALSWNRILLHLDKVGPKTAQKITRTLGEASDPFQALGNYKGGKKWQEGLTRLAELFFEILRTDHTPGAMYELVRGYYEPLFQKLYHDDYPKREKDLDQLQGIISGYADLQTFVDDTTLDPPDPKAGSASDSPDRMILSTIHSSKGLEWEAVCVIGLADGRFPHSSAGPGEQWEEERRLLYVAATRAKKYLYLSYPSEFMTLDRQFHRVSMSPFLAELDNTTYRMDHGRDSFSSFNNSSQQPSPSLPSVKNKKKKKLQVRDFPVGTRVEHPFFGVGDVTSVVGNRSLGVHFHRHGLKTLHLDYAKLDVVAG